MSSLLNKLVDKLGQQGQGSSNNTGYSNGGYGGNPYYGGQQYPPQAAPYGGPPPQYGNQGPPQYGNQGPPQVPPPWVAEWDPSANRWFFINRETGYRTYDHPYSQQGGYGGGGGGGGGYPNQGQYGGPANYGPGNYGPGNYGPGNYGPGNHASYGPSERTQFAGGGYYEAPAQQGKSHTGRNVAIGAAAGLVGGALLMHEGQEIKEGFEENKDRLESEVSQGMMNAEQSVQDFPDDAARWTGEKVQEVENIPQNIENRWDDAVQDVQDVPEDMAGWVGGKVGDVERFGDDVHDFGGRMEDAYDDGRDEARYDDDDW